MSDFVRQTPVGDNRERSICASCGHIDYENPKIITGAVVVHDGHVLLCRRAIAPRVGFWTLPAGYLELGETVEAGACREAYEEAEADIQLDGILAVYSIARIGQVQIIFRARFSGEPAYAAGIESQEVRLFAWDEIPWAELAFPSVHWSLQAWRDSGSGPIGAPQGNPGPTDNGPEPVAPGPYPADSSRDDVIGASA